MGQLRKITVEVREDDLQSAQAYTGQGVTETVPAALKKLAAIRAHREFLKLRGSYKFGMNLNEPRKDRAESSPPVPPPSSLS
jgi:hypothetical protein